MNSFHFNGVVLIFLKVTNAQTLNINLSRHVLVRAKAEILHLLELLIENNRPELVDLLVDVVDIVLHCVDNNHLKAKSVSELFSPICFFPQISHCTQTRRIAVGTKSGIYILILSFSQSIFYTL